MKRLKDGERVKEGDAVYVPGRGKARVTNTLMYPTIIVDTGREKLKVTAYEVLRIDEEQPKEPEGPTVEEYDHAVFDFMDMMVDEIKGRGYDVDSSMVLNLMTGFAHVRKALWPKAPIDIAGEEDDHEEPER